jgi:hypothetical protein
MALELWMHCGGHWFVETDFGDVVVGQAERSSGGTWRLEISDEWFFDDVPDLEAAKRIFIDNYSKAHAAAQLGPGSSSNGPSAREGFTIVTL